MEKNFDAVKMVRMIRDKHYEETKGKSYQEKMEIYRIRAADVLNVREQRVLYQTK